MNHAAALTGIFLSIGIWFFLGIIGDGGFHDDAHLPGRNVRPIGMDCVLHEFQNAFSPVGEQQELTVSARFGGFLQHDPFSRRVRNPVCRKQCAVKNLVILVHRLVSPCQNARIEIFPCVMKCRSGENLQRFSIGMAMQFPDRKRCTVLTNVMCQTQDGRILGLPDHFVEHEP